MDGMEAVLACFVRQSRCCSFVLVIFDGQADCFIYCEVAGFGAVS